MDRPSSYGVNLQNPTFNLTVILGGVTMSSHEVKIGDHAHIENSTIVAGMIQDSFKSIAAVENEPLRKQLSDLHNVVSELIAKLPTPEGKQDAAAALKTLTAEATRPDPRPKWFDVSAEGLMDAAKGIVELGGRLVPLLATIRPLIFPS